ncbi:hypothetical protein HNQ96_005793 [Aminobacter lissarensis]|uniref:Uncharacterized protein n=1 Tax=Aminobacter carboxidus TaxID=376165 RepID=A0A8E2BFT4_9HYPH|nr:hypothetical protein [Aminobacter lissarensis]MBB6469899.1 hypothetical protein [Aminobacter lissarensis]
MILKAAEVMKACKALLYLPCCLIRVGKTAAETARLVKLMHVGAPIGSISDGSGGGGATTLSAIARLGRCTLPSIVTPVG